MASPTRVTAAPSLPKSDRMPAPNWIKPQLAALVKAAPEGDDWLHEIKLDGYRHACLARGRQGPDIDPARQ